MSPPHQAAVAESILRQVRDIDDRSLLHSCSSRASRSGCDSEANSSLSSFLSGQNHPTNVMKTGTEPITTAHGVKIEPTNSPVTAIPARKGQMEGSGNFDLWSGTASSTCVTSTSRISLRSPVTTGGLRVAPTGFLFLPQSGCAGSCNSEAASVWPIQACPRPTGCHPPQARIVGSKKH
jgi:hypothetical protein